MSARLASRRFGVALWAGSLVFAGVAAVLAFANHELAGDAGDLVLFTSVATVGFLVTRSQPRNALGWLLLCSASLVVLVFALSQAGVYGVTTHAGAVPGAIWLAWLGTWGWLLGFGPLLVYVPLLFPDGRLPSRRWRPFAWGTTGFVAVVLAATMLQPGPMTSNNRVVGTNPLGLTAAGSSLKEFISVGYAVAVVATLVAAFSVILRYRRAGTEERRQIKWFGYGVLWMAVLFALGGVASGLGRVALSDVLATIGFLGLPVGAGVAMLRHKLWDVDVVVTRTVVYGLLAAFISAVYVGIVIGIGTAVGSRGNVFLSIVATAIVALTFQPLRERARHVANRVVFGTRATPYEVLSQFGERMAATYSIADVLPRTARILAEGTGAVRAEVWVCVGGTLERRAAWPEGSPAEGSDRIDVADDGADGAVAVPGASATAAVRHQGELLGALAIRKAPNDPLRPAEERLLADVASQAGLVLRNVRLVEELQASRRRMVAAQDEARRRLERNVHDGAQQQLVALSIKAGLAERLVERDSRARDLLAQLQADATAALEELRNLARGIYPPLLADRGLVAALEAQATRAPLPVSVDGSGIGRYAQDAEAAVYFCVLEALQNVAKYAGATRAMVELRERDGRIAFAVTDDGRGFNATTTSYGTGLQGMADRLAAQGGSLDVRSTPGRGTTVLGEVPAERRDPDRRLDVERDPDGAAADGATTRSDLTEVAG